MRKKRGWRRAAALALSAVLLAGTALALYDAIWPQQSGTDVLFENVSGKKYAAEG